MLGKFLLNTVETYRVSTVNDVEALHEDFKADNRYEIASFSYTTKYDKKEDVEYQVVKVKKISNAEKVLTNKIDINYTEGQGVSF
jgi:hypothetical protein